MQKIKSCICGAKTRTHKKCPNHLTNELIYICSRQQCLQPLCKDCVKIHNQKHNSIHTQPNIVDLDEIQDFYESYVDKQLKFINSDNKQSFHTPSQQIQSYIDEFFYGSKTGRQAQLKNIRQKIKGSQYDVHALIRLVEQGHQYKLGPNFKEKYFRFLDFLIQQMK